jgi:hypothetical protein
MMDFWNNRIPDIFKNLPPSESANAAERPEILPPDEPLPKEPQYYSPLGENENRWSRFPPLQGTHAPPIYGTVVNSGGEKSRATSTVLLGVDREFGSRLNDKNIPGAVEQPQEVETGSSSSLAMSIVIVIGVCLLVVNLCAFAGLYYQRDRLKVQERLMRKRYEDVEPRNANELYTSGRRKNEENDDENITAIKMTEMKDNTKNKKNQQSEEMYEAVRSRGKTLDGREGALEEADAGENNFRRWRLSRQCSASTMDPHTKVREWIAHEIVHRCSPRFLRRTKVQVQQQTNRPVLQKDSSLDTSMDQLSSAVMTTENREPNTSSPALSKPTTTTTLQRARVKKVSVAVDATPAARGPSVLKQIPIEQMSKSMEELGGDRNIAVSAEKNVPVLKRSETCRESLVSSSLSPVPSHSPQRDTVLRRSATSINFQVCPPILKKQNNGLNIVHQHSKSDPVPHTASFMHQSTPQPSHSQGLVPHVYDIRVDTKVNPSTLTYAEGLPVKQMKTFPTSGTHVKFKPNALKKDVGITASPNTNCLEDINVTSRDSSLNTDGQISTADPLKNIQRRNFPKVLPDLPPGPEILTQQQNQISSADRDLTPVQAVAAKRLSLPPPSHLLAGILARNNDAGSYSQQSTPSGANQKDIHTQTQAGRVPPPPPPRISSTLGRKPNNTTPIAPLETKQESSKLKTIVLASSPTHHQRPEPRVIIKPTSVSSVTRNPAVTHQNKAKHQIPRVTPNTGEDYPLTTTTLHQSGIISPAASLNKETPRRNQQEPQTHTVLTSPTQPQVHKTAELIPRQDTSTTIPTHKIPVKKSTDTTWALLSAEDTSSNTGTVKRVKKSNQTSAHSPEVANQSTSKVSNVPKGWYAQYNQSFLSKTKDSEN